MRVSPTDKIADVSVRAIRDYFRKCGYVSGIDALASGLSISGQAASALHQQLVADGYIARDEASDDGGFNLTVKGNALSIAKFLKPISRSRGTELVNELIERAKSVNQNGELTHVVQEIIGFGSYIKDTPDLGDLDLIIKLAPRPGIGDFVNASRVRASASGRNLGLIQTLAYGQIEVTKLVKGKSPYISLHSETELSVLDLETKQIFVAKPETLAPATTRY